MTKNFNSVLCFLGRKHGLSGLNALVESGRFNVCAVFTHRNNPGSEDPDKNERDDYGEYVNCCNKMSIPLYTADSPEDFKNIEGIVQTFGKIDFIVSISWRRLISEICLTQVRFGGINIHRGKLPDYSGAYPIRRAIENGDDEIVVTAHKMTSDLDMGEIIACANHPINYQSSFSLEENVERIKCEIEPLFGTIAIRALDQLMKNQPC